MLLGYLTYTIRCVCVLSITPKSLYMCEHDLASSWLQLSPAISYILPPPSSCFSLLSGVVFFKPFPLPECFLSVNMRCLFSALSSNITCLENPFLSSWTSDCLPAPNPPLYSAVQNPELGLELGAGAGTQLTTFLFFLCQLASC